MFHDVDRERQVEDRPGGERLGADVEPLEVHALGAGVVVDERAQAGHVGKTGPHGFERGHAIAGGLQRRAQQTGAGAHLEHACAGTRARQVVCDRGGTESRFAGVVVDQTREIRGLGPEAPAGPVDPGIDG